jgi:hypothetical protein
MGAMDLHAAWFSTLGAPLGEGEEADIRAYVDGLGLASKLPTLVVQSWAQAGELIRHPAGAWWQAEEAERARLEAGLRLAPADRQWLALTDTLHGAAAVAAARGGGADPGLIRAAAGAATYAAYQHRLAVAAGAAAAHPFMRKHALFAGGRWPLGLYGDRFAIF